MPTEYEQQLLDTIERQQKSLEDARMELDTILGIGEKIRSECTKMRFTKEAMDDLKGMYGIDLVEAVSDVIRENAKKIAEEEIQKIKAKYGN